MGHTRWRARGNEFNNRNNHPIRSGIVIGAHDGAIRNANHRFRRLGLPRYAEVDSEPIFRLADRFAPEGPVEQGGLKKALALCRGQMIAAPASRLDPGSISVPEGNKPLRLRIHRRHRVALCASKPAPIHFAANNETKPPDSGFGRAEGTPEGTRPKGEPQGRGESTAGASWRRRP